MSIKLRVSEIQRFCMHDGPGVRTTVFLKGCPLRCAWCHNPETQRREAEILFYRNKCIACGGCAALCPLGVHTLEGEHCIAREKCTACALCAENCPSGALELCGREMTVAEILETVEKDRAFYGETGGVTLSGGEPFLQGEGALLLLRASRERGITTAAETCGYASPEILKAALPLTDLFLFDIKDTDAARHKAYTGVSNEPILQNLKMLDAAGARIRLRCILVNGVNTERAHYAAIADIAGALQGLTGVEFLPYHAYGGTKSVFLGGEDSGRADWIPEAAQIEEAKSLLRERGVPVL